MAHPSRGVARASTRAGPGRQVDVRGLQQARVDRVASRARSSNAPAQPTQNRHLGRGVARLQHPHVEAAAQSMRASSGWPQGFSPAPRPAQQAPASVGNRESAITRLPAQVDDRVHVLDVDRTCLHAGAARHAVPDDLVRDGVRDERLQLDVPASDAASIPAAPTGHVVA